MTDVRRRTWAWQQQASDETLKQIPYHTIRCGSYDIKHRRSLAEEKLEIEEKDVPQDRGRGVSMEMKIKYETVLERQRETGKGGKKSGKLRGNSASY